MLPLFVLYAQERHGIAAPQALLILALFQALAYLGGLPGGWLADRALGTRKATLLGAALLACGYGLLALDRAELLWPALLTMVLGHSAFRPGLHVLLARVADADEKVRARVFLWHYLAANLGYAAGALFGEWAHARAGWCLLFGGATAASVVAVMLLIAGLPWLVRRQGAPLMSQRGSPAHRCSEYARCLVAVRGGGDLLADGTASREFTDGVRSDEHSAERESAQPHDPDRPRSLCFAARSDRAGHAARVPCTSRAKDATPTIGNQSDDLGLRGHSRGLCTDGSGGTSRRRSGARKRCMARRLLRAAVAGRSASCAAGVSLLTQLAPKHKAAQAVGLWFAGSAIGNGLAGALGLCWDRWPHHRYFAVLAAVSLAAAVPLLSRRRHLDWLTALAVSAASQPEIGSRTQTMNPTSEPEPCAHHSTARCPGHR